MMALHESRMKGVREAVSEPEAVSDRVCVGKKMPRVSLSTIAFVDERRPGRYRFRF